MTTAISDAPKAVTRKPRVPHLPLTAAQQKLAEDYLPLARAIARPFKAQWTKYHAALDSAALLGITSAAQRFDASRGVKFATYARFFIVGELKDALRQVDRERQFDHGAASREIAAHHLPRASRIMKRSANHPWSKLTSYEPPVGTRAEDVESVEQWLKVLPSRHAEVLRAVYLEDLTQSELAGRQSIAKSRISQLHSEALAMLRSNLESEIESEESATEGTDGHR